LAGALRALPHRRRGARDARPPGRRRHRRRNRRARQRRRTAPRGRRPPRSRGPRMSSKFSDALGRMFDVETTVELLQYDFVQQALVAGAILGLLAGVIGPLIISRQMAFSVHGTSELSLTGAAAALIIG